MPPLTGDFGKLDRWIERLSELAEPGSLARLSNDMADATLELVDREFDESRAPSGAAWAAKKHPDGRPVGTGKTGGLRRYRRKHADSRGFRIGPSVPYAGYFVRGKRGQKPRPIVPRSNHLPAPWRGALTRLFLLHCQKILRGGR